MPLLPDLPGTTGDLSQDSSFDFRGLRELDRQSEIQALEGLLGDARQDPRLATVTESRALRLIRAARARPLSAFTEFLSAWELSTEEGRTLMTLAEALLRIPDTRSADRLINDLLSRTDWTASLKQTSLRVKTAGWGLAMGARFIREEDLPGRSHQLLLKLGDAVFRPALAAGLRLMAGQFVQGETMAEAVAHRQQGIRYSFDCLGEAAQTAEDAEHYTTAYHDAIRMLAGQDKALSLQARDGISIKLSALHPRYEYAQWSRVRPELMWRLRQLLHAAAEAGIPVTLDAEESERLELGLMLFADALHTPGLSDWHGLGIAVQAYQKRAPAVLAWLQDTAQKSGHRIPVRLVKGAYWDSEIKRAQQLGLAGYPVYTRKRHTDVAYLACARKMLNAPHAFFSQFATHNAHTLAWLETMAESLNAPFERQRLVGMGENVHAAFSETFDRPLRLYAPVGRFTVLLPYLVRRLLENGSSQSFVSQLADPEIPETVLAQNPIEKLGAETLHSNPNIPLPQAIFTDRPNSPGFTLADADELMQIHYSDRKKTPFPVSAGPLLAFTPQHHEATICVSPANTTHTLGSVKLAQPADIRMAAEHARTAYPAWSARPVSERADLLRDLANALLDARDELLALLVQEAGKTIGDALSEWREAFDYCQYYANEGERLMANVQPLPAISGEHNQLSLHGRGVFLCISPWNFPLAIFLGQIAAALVTGNTVLAKPASQTSLIAFRVIQLAHHVGIPREVLQLLPAAGKTIQENLLAHPALAGVVFTGSVAVATTLSRALATREGARLPLIAETGGLNVMIADSSALPEQLVSDVMASAFTSAGQRCSALRVLWVQEEIADTVLHRLKGVMNEWQTGDPARLAVDMGPVIDPDSAVQLQRIIMEWQTRARWMAHGPMHSDNRGHFVSPHAFLLTREDLPREEVFGPVLAIATWAQDELPHVVEWVNRSGYGLTLGIHSRLDSTLSYVRTQTRVGNTYENRNQIGAVVGCQPFGGEGLSGTGFKAGGPHYLLRFVTERTITTNLSAVGINTGLLGLHD